MIAEIVESKVFHPGVGRFVTQEEFKAIQDSVNEEAEIEACFNLLPKRLEEKIKGKPKEEKISSFAKKILTAKVAENPRKAGTKGRLSFQIILENPGITFEKFKELGGRSNDLQWDIDHNWVEVK